MWGGRGNGIAGKPSDHQNDNNVPVAPPMPSAVRSSAARRRHHPQSQHFNRPPPQSVCDAREIGVGRNGSHAGSSSISIDVTLGSRGNDDSTTMPLRPVGSSSPNSSISNKDKKISRNKLVRKGSVLALAIVFIVIWMTVMMLLLTRLANNEEQTFGGDDDNTNNSYGQDVDVENEIPVVATQMYTFTHPTNGQTSVAVVAANGKYNGRTGIDQQMQLEEDYQHHPRGPIFYATPKMRPFQPVVLTTTSAPLSTKRRALQKQWDDLGALDPMLRVAPGEEAAPQDHDRQPYVQGDCVPMTEWQATSFPNCNAFHEMHLMGAGVNGTASVHGRYPSSLPPHKYTEDSVHFLGRGWFRAAWKVDFGLDETNPVVLKTLRLEREFYDEYYDLHRKDAVAMERLTSSPYVIDIYGYCGQSAINELADFFAGFNTLQSFARQLQDNFDEKVLRLKLQVSAMLALGVAHMHHLEGENNATMVHYDINPKNVAIVKGGNPKLNDFNTVEFLRWNTKTNKPCGFRGRLHEPWWRAPEELIMPRELAEGKNISSQEGLVDSVEDQPRLDEKIDVWSLGNLLYNMLTGHAARGQARTWRYGQVRRDVLHAVLPWRPTDAKYLNSTQPAIVAMRRAVERCIIKDPKKRWSALDVAYEMMDTLDVLMDEVNKKKKKKKKA